MLQSVPPFFLEENNVIQEFNAPKIIGIVSDPNEGKSNLAHYLIKELKENYTFKLYTYGFRTEISGTPQIFSIREVEEIRDSIIFIDEFYTLFDLEDRRKKMMVENTLRLLFHNNNILVLIGVGENFKKFVSGKLNTIFFKKVTFSDLINGSSMKRAIQDYKGYEKGSAVLNLKKNEVIVYNGKNYRKFLVPYLKEADSKVDNVSILTKKNVK